MTERYFTLEEASAALPEVERLIVRLREARDEMLLAKARHDTLWERLRSGESVLDDLLAGQRELDARAQAATAIAARVADIGCVLRDLDLGLVDFPAIAAGAEVFLCWKLGEDAIRFWHSQTEGYAGRKPLRALPGGPVH